MAARRGVVVDRHGRVVEDRRRRAGRSGFAGAMQWIDHQQRAVVAAMDDDTQRFAISDAPRRRVRDAYAGFKDRLSRGMHRHRKSGPTTAWLMASETRAPTPIWP